MTALTAVEAPCADDPDLFTSTKRRDFLVARLVCRGCPHQLLCADVALTDTRASGTYAGVLFKKGTIAKTIPWPGVTR